MNSLNPFYPFIFLLVVLILVFITTYHALKLIWGTDRLFRQLEELETELEAELETGREISTTPLDQRLHFHDIRNVDGEEIEINTISLV